MSGCITPPCLLRACSGAFYSPCALQCVQKHTAANNNSSVPLLSTVQGETNVEFGHFLNLQMTPQMLPQTL